MEADRCARLTHDLISSRLTRKYRRQVGFATLREFVTQRPSLRPEAITMLLELTTHSGVSRFIVCDHCVTLLNHDVDKVTRGAAINTVKKWIPETEPMASMIRDFALQLLRRLQSRPKIDKAEEPRPDGEENMEDGQLPQEDIIQTPYLPEQLELPAHSDQVLQHLELLFALSTKVPEFLDECVPSMLLHKDYFNGCEECLPRMVECTSLSKKQYNS